MGLCSSLGFYTFFALVFTCIGIFNILLQFVVDQFQKDLQAALRLSEAEVQNVKVSSSIYSDRGMYHTCFKQGFENDFVFQ